MRKKRRMLSRDGLNMHQTEMVGEREERRKRNVRVDRDTKNYYEPDTIVTTREGNMY